MPCVLVVSREYRGYPQSSQVMVVTVRIGLVGSGYIARHFSLAVGRYPEYSVSKVLTRRPIARCKDLPFQGQLTNSVNELIDNSDVLLECSGDPIRATAS